ncbi:MAG: N-formylglutamate amidohydrolase [Caulobacteraceae bacterium]|nr:MAG: N-formylglutamate amidohydrolase [Caulobacteraceae bacterium]
MSEQGIDLNGMASGLLVAGEGSPVIARNSGAESPFFLIADHAGQEIPLNLNNLQLPHSERQRHIALDIGVAGMGPILADDLGACLIAQRYSRLVIDCNRNPQRRDAICEVSDGTVVPANLDLTPADRQARIDAIFTPYHAAIDAELDARGDRPTVVVALHASPFSDAMLARLREAFGPEVVGDNQPYRMDDIDYSIPRHAIGRGLDYLELEVRQDLMADPAGEAAVAARIAPLLRAALADIGLGG